MQQFTFETIQELETLFQVTGSQVEDIVPWLQKQPRSKIPLVLWRSGISSMRSVPACWYLLVIMSLASWYVILTKLWDQRRLRKDYVEVHKGFWTAGNLRDGINKLEQGKCLQDGR